MATKSTRKAYPQKSRDYIKTTLILKKLMDHVLNDTELSPTQLGAAKTLLDRTLPALSAMDITVEDVNESKRVEQQEWEALSTLRHQIRDADQGTATEH